MFAFLSRQVGISTGHIGSEQTEDCAAIHAASFSYPWPPEELEAILSARNTFAEGAFVKGALIGFVISRLAADEAEILTIAVLPKRRGQGIAGKLLRANSEQIVAAGARTWFLEVEAQNASALALYKRFGFEKVGERQSYYKKADGDAATAFILRRNLT